MSSKNCCGIQSTTESGWPFNSIFVIPWIPITHKVDQNGQGNVADNGGKEKKWYIRVCRTISHFAPSDRQWREGKEGRGYTTTVIGMSQSYPTFNLETQIEISLNAVLLGVKFIHHIATKSTNWKNCAKIKLVSISLNCFSLLVIHPSCLSWCQKSQFYAHNVWQSRQKRLEQFKMLCHDWDLNITLNTARNQT